MEQKFISVILPTYNEKDNITALIKAVHEQLAAWPHEIIVVDDQSPDGTYEAVSRLGDKQLKAVLRAEEPSLARSIRRGLEEAGGNIIVVMDSDFDHDPKYLPLMVNTLSHYDCVCASRFLYGGGMNGRLHALTSWLFNIFIRTVTHSPLTDHLYGYFAIKRTILEQCPYDKIFYGYGDYYIRLLYALQKNQALILQFPAVNGGRVRQKNMSILKIFWQYFLAVLRLPSYLESHV